MDDRLKLAAESVHESDGRNFATGFGEISPRQSEMKLLRLTGVFFMVSDLGAIAF